MILPRHHKFRPVGGSIFAGLLKYGHGVRTGTTKDDIDVSVEEGEEREPRM